MQVQADNYGLPHPHPRHDHTLRRLFRIRKYFPGLAWRPWIRSTKGDRSAQSFIPPSTEYDLQMVSNDVSRRLSETCEKSTDSSRCTWECSPAQLLLNSTTPRLAGPYQCLKTICQGGIGLPFANQDVVGIGVVISLRTLLMPQSIHKIADDRQVTISCVIQRVLVLFSWLGLAIASWTSFNRPIRSGSDEKAKEVFLESLDSFQLAQCYFSIPIAVLL